MARIRRDCSAQVSPRRHRVGNTRPSGRGRATCNAVARKAWFEATLAADHGEVAVSLGPAGLCGIADLDLSARLEQDLVAWNDRYQPVLDTSLDERHVEPLASLIAVLDAEGRTLARRLGRALGGRARVRYYSEGLLRDLR